MQISIGSNFFNIESNLSQTMSSSQQPMSLAGIFSAARPIVKANSRHFTTLTVLFILPLAFLVTVSTTLHSLFLLRVSDLNFVALLFPLLSSFTALFLFISAVGSISISHFNAFFNRPVNLVNALRSLHASFLPLLFTTLLSASVQFAASTLAIVLLISVVKGFEFLGFGNGTPDFGSIYVFIFAVVIGSGLLSFLVVLNIEWGLVCVIVVVEGSCGLVPFKRSSKLVQGMRGEMLRFMLFFGLMIGFTMWFSAGYGENLRDLSSSWLKGLGFVVRTLATTALLTFLMFNCVSAPTVLYLYAMTLNGELPGDISEWSVKEYVSLPIDEETA